MALKAAVHIETALRDGKTFLKNSFCDAPFKLGDVTEDKSKKGLHLMLMSSSPGILDGDEYSFQIRLGEGTATALQTQSYQRIFQMKKGAAQRMNINLEAGTSFVYLPHPVVPHKDSSFTSRSRISLTDRCSLIWGEVISCGRKLNDEIFQFTSFHSTMEIYRNECLIVKENVFIKPAEMNLAGLGQMEGYTHQASFLYINDSASVDELINRLAADLESSVDIGFGISALPANGFVLRLLGFKAEQLFILLQRIAAFVQLSAPFVVSKAKARV